MVPIKHQTRFASSRFSALAIQFLLIVRTFPRSGAQAALFRAAQRSALARCREGDDDAGVSEFARGHFSRSSLKTPSDQAPDGRLTDTAQFAPCWHWRRNGDRDIALSWGPSGAFSYLITGAGVGRSEF